MSLMNGPPVAALQSPWEAFGPPGRCGLPGRCAEPPEGGRGAAVSARVQVILSRLRCDGAPLGRGRARAPHGGPDAPRMPPACPARGPAAALDPTGVGGAAGPGPSGLDSDSDDSVDRDIEEAIQAYLQARGGAGQPDGAPDRDPRGEPTLRGSAPTAPGSCRPAASEDPGATSPVSASSEDSFEQSIRAEIEAFLLEKRRHQAACGLAADAGPGPGERPARPALRPGREPGARPRPRGLPGACREFIFRKPPRLAKAPPRTLRSRAAPGPGSLGSAKPATPGRPPEAVHSPGQEARRGAALGRQGRLVGGPGPAPEASESSSDDGIEEAIQLYQLEKRRGAGGDPQGEEPGPSPPAQSALPEPHRRTSGKKKPVATKAVALGPGGLDPDHPCQPPRDSPAAGPPGSTTARGEGGDRASGRADTSAELMCAEAILDISKAILPAPEQGGDAPGPGSPRAPSPDAPPRAPGDSSSADSDDSIEREIRTFLARKAQSAGFPAPQSPRPAPGPPCLSGGPQASPPHPPDLPPGCRRKRRGGHAQRLSTPKRPREVARGSAQEAAGQGRAGETPTRDGESRARPPPRALGLGEGQRGPAATARSGEGKGGSGDKSSSLDSDEDLDTAIKDLLRSKRRKKCKDPRAARGGKGRWGCAPQLLGPAGGPQGGWAERSCPSGAAGRPGLLCSRAQSRSATQAAPTALRSQSRAPGGGPLPCDSGSPGSPGPSPGPLSEDSSCVDSDDSIELEIRRFLAAKAQECPRAPGVRAGAPAPPGAGGRKPPAPLPSVCTRSQRGRAPSQPAEAPGDAPVLGGRSSPRAEPAGAPAALVRCEAAPPRGSGRTAGARGGRKSAGARRDPRPSGAEPPSAGEGVLGQRHGGARGPACQREAAPRAGSAPPWRDLAHQSRLQGAWALGPEGGGPAWRGGAGSERGPGAQAQCAPSLAMDPKRGLAFAGFPSLLSTQLFHFGKSVSWGGSPASLFGAPLSLPLAGPAFSAFREAQADPGPVFGSSAALVTKAGGHWPPRKPQAGLSLPDRRNGGRGGPGGRRRARGGVRQDALRSDASELGDASAEEAGGPGTRGRVLQS